MKEKVKQLEILHTKSARCGETGFTLIELLVVISIIALLIGLLLPALGAGLETARTAVCLSQQRQMAIAVSVYVGDYEGQFPIATEQVMNGSVSESRAWDFTTVKDWTAGGKTTIRPGIIWQDLETPADIHQCPSFDGPANWGQDPATGYNYNTDYLGTFAWQWDSVTGSMQRVEPAFMVDVGSPNETAMFGDGQYSAGANKFMRGPEIGRDPGFTGRYAGTQGFRHAGRTNIAWVDGHASSQSSRFTNTNSDDRGRIAEGTGFISEDNQLYDLK